MFVVSTTNVEKLTIPNGRDLTSGLDPSKFLRVKKLKGTPPRSVRPCVTDVAVKDIGPVHIILLHISVSYINKAKEVNLTENFEGTSYLDASDFANELD